MSINQQASFIRGPYFFITLFISLLCYLFLNWQHIIVKIVEWQKLFHGKLAEHVHQISTEPYTHGSALIGLSFLYGVFHAIGPGHGKAVIITYLGSHKETLKRGALISLLAALLQAMIAIVLVTIVAKLLRLKLSSINNLGDDITQVSYALVMSLGAFLFLSSAISAWNKWRIRSKENKIEHKPQATQFSVFTHQHTENCGCGAQHVYQSAPLESWWQSISVIFSMGLRPCAGAIVVLIYAHLVDAYMYGMLATLIMGLGTGLSIAGIALGTQIARSKFEQFADSGKQKFSVVSGPWLRMLGGFILFFLGWSLFQASLLVNEPHPLF